MEPAGSSAGGMGAGRNCELAKKKAIAVKWERQASQTAGYEIPYSTGKK